VKFNTFNFIGGMLPVIPDASKIPDGSYRIAKNIRTRDNIVKPVASPLDLTDNLTAGAIQGGEMMGGWAIVFVQGIAYARYLNSVNNQWQQLTGYRLTANAVDIYTEVVPLSFNAFLRNNHGDTQATIPQVANGFYSDQGGGIPCLVAQDGTKRPMLIHPDASGLSFSCRPARTYSEWTQDNPEYIPIGKQMCWDGNRLHIVIRGRFRYEEFRAVAKSVNNRPLDFMVVLDSDGNKLVDESQGDARITSYGVDFDEISAVKVVNNSQVAVIVATQKNLWQAVPDYTNVDQTFGEPIYRPIFISGTGAISQHAFAETTINIDSGSTAFVSQAGVRAINTASQNRFEGKNYPLSREVSKLLAGITQDAGAAIQFNDYSYFALKTTHGNGVLVYDSILSKWASLDQYPEFSGNNSIFKFSLLRIPGKQRLIAFTRTKVLAMEEGSYYDSGIYIGDFSSLRDATIRVEQIPTFVYLNFIDNNIKGTAVVDVFCDERFSQSISTTLTVSPPVPRISSFPYPSRKDNANSTTIAVTSPIQCFRHGYWINWNTDGALSYLAVDSEETNTLTNLEQKAKVFQK